MRFSPTSSMFYALCSTLFLAILALQLTDTHVFSSECRQAKLILSHTLVLGLGMVRVTHTLFAGLIRTNDPSQGP